MTTFISIATIFMSMKSMSAAIVNRKWATPKEIWGMTRLLILSVGLTEYLGSFKQFTDRLLTLWTKSGKKYLVLYMKEALAHVIAFLNHVRRPYNQGAPGLRLSRAGLPTIIPTPLRQAIMRFRAHGGLRDGLVLRTVLTVLSMYRVLNLYRSQIWRRSLTLLTGLAHCSILMSWAEFYLYSRELLSKVSDGLSVSQLALTGHGLPGLPEQML